MRLIARDASMTMCPIRPLSSEVFQKQFTKGFTVVTNNATIRISSKRVFLIHYIGERTKIVATTLLKLFIQLGCPVSTIHFIGIIKHGMREGHLLMGKGCVKTLKVTSYSIAVEVINHKPFATRSSTFHFLLRKFHGGILIGIKYNLLRSILFLHQRSAEWPTRTGCHIGLNTQFCASFLHIL